MVKESRPRRQRRERQRALKKDVQRLDVLASQLPGGSAAHPLPVPSASAIEIKARAEKCVRCGGDVDLRGEDTTVTARGVVRRVDVVCRGCHAPRSLWFLVAAAGAN